MGAMTTKVMLEESYEHAKKILDAGCKLLTLGGDHTIPYGMVRAASEKYGKLALLHFDSHQDSTPTTDGNVSHANFAYDLQAEGCIGSIGSTGNRNTGNRRTVFCPDS